MAAQIMVAFVMRWGKNQVCVPLCAVANHCCAQCAVGI